MVDINYVRQYFSEHAAVWLAEAYNADTLVSEYPTGAVRVRLAIEAIVERIGSTECQLADLGCGGGELCIHAARLGIQATGLDIAEGMISEARKNLETLPKDIQKRLNFIQGGVFDRLLPAGKYDAVTALGLIEYLPEDVAFFREASRLLKPGGILVVSCRNRLFNMASLNEYTSNEIERGAARALISEIESLPADKIPIDSIGEFVSKLRSNIPQLEETIKLDDSDKKKVESVEKRPPEFTQPRRQHTPSEFNQAAQTSGFIRPAFLGVHPHILPPRLEAIAPHFYNRFASVFEAFEKSPVSLIWSSAFIGVFTKPG